MQMPIAKGDELPIVLSATGGSGLEAFASCPVLSWLELHPAGMHGTVCLKVRARAHVKFAL